MEPVYTDIASVMAVFEKRMLRWTFKLKRDAKENSILRSLIISTFLSSVQIGEDQREEAREHMYGREGERERERAKEFVNLLFWKRKGKIKFEDLAVDEK
jgi:hypothetical protein